MKHIAIIFLVCSQLTFVKGQLRLDANNHLFLNHSGGTIGSSDFIVSREGGTFMGMYMNSINSSNSQPFYGYAVDGGIRSFHYYEENSDLWNLWLLGANKLQVGIESSAFSTDLVIDGGLSAASDLFIIDDATSRMLFNFDKDRLPIGASNFVVSDDSNFGGMYVNSDDLIDGSPFYGYSIDGVPLAYDYLRGADTSWHFVHYDGLEVFNIGKQEISMRYRNIDLGDGTEGASLLTIDDVNDKMYFNYDFSFGDNISLAEFILRGEDNVFTGMYIDSKRTFNGNVYYGYSINGTSKIYTNYNDFFESWSVTYNDTGEEGIVVRRKHTDFGGGINVQDVSANGTFPGTIYYDNGHFWGYTDTGIKQLDNTTNFDSPTDSKSDVSGINEEIKNLKKENVELKSKLQVLEEQVQLLLDLQKKQGE